MNDDAKNNPGRIINAYFSATTTLPKTKQVVMLYDGAIRYAQQALEAIGEGDIEKRFKALTQASAIISGLHGCLDFTGGGEVARILDGFYSTIAAEINDAIKVENKEKCLDIITELKNMRDAWTQIDGQQHNGSAPAQSSLPEMINVNSSSQKQQSASTYTVTGASSVDTSNFAFSA